MRVFVKGLNPCALRKLKITQYRDFLTANGHELVDSPQKSDVVMLWTCGVRDDYRCNSLSEIKRYEKELEKEVLIAGCLPDIDPQSLENQSPGHIINWRDDAEKMEAFFGSPNKKLYEVPMDYAEKKHCDNARVFKEKNPGKDACFLDESIKLYVSHGCNLQCAYCSERLMFPPYHSYPEDELVATCKKIVDETGQLDVMLHADQVGAYGMDRGSSLTALIRKLKTIHHGLRIGLQGFNPADFLRYYDDMVEFITQGTLFHLRLPIQSASSRILKLMNRPYTREHIDTLFRLLNDIGFMDFATDIIVGFPGETEEDFDETLEFALRHHPRYILLCAFMDVAGLPASRLPDKVNETTIERRLLQAHIQICDAGIYCNTDGGPIAQDRMRRINDLSTNIYEPDPVASSGVFGQSK